MWCERLEKNSELMLCCVNRSDVVGFAFGRLYSDYIVIAQLAVSSEYRRQGIASRLVKEIELKAKRLGVKVIRLGAVDSARQFYAKIGYISYLLVQSKLHSVDELLSLESGCQIHFTKVYEDKNSQICLKTNGAVTELSKCYEDKFTGCYTMTLFEKHLEF